jgi:hypothetical protein
MSEIMFNEIGVDGKMGTYKFGDWRSYAKHTDTEIKGFFGEYRWLSNFWTAPVYFDGMLYQSTENAYQAAKLIPEHREIFLICSAAESKREWKKPIYNRLYSPEEWEEIKYSIMMALVFDKFYRNKDLRNKLISTENKYLEETNHWKDQCWGVDIHLGGTNWLGQILTINRKIWQTAPKCD